ncbi:gliding motility-associated C-terminal domain-containing protein [Maribacter sp. IgM3_T14_3]|uniref:T9SS type B sorting domain-containing protein n=1 Tax=Maribacter sp. IgM3_T14_3 TaxID=3415140 RepID=UPI003C6ECE50
MKSRIKLFSKLRNTFFFGLFLLGTNIGFSQLSDLHYLPPLRQTGPTNDVPFRNQALYLSTPVLTPFNVNIYQGTNPVAIATVSVSNSAPFVYALANNNNNITMVEEANTGIVLSNSGLRLESPGGQLFYVSYRGNSTAQGENLTSKGRTALGTSFKWGGIPSINSGTFRENHNATLGIMASEDNTTIRISDYDTGCTFRQGTNPDAITADELTITLDAGQTYVLEAWIGNNIINRYGTIGANIESDKDIVISNGNLMLGLIQNINNQDACLDQSVPINKLGKEYIFMRGNGRDELEFPVIIATENATTIFINDETTPAVTLNEGEYYQIPGSKYSGVGAGNNMFVRASKNVYAYQLTAGSDGFPNLGMNFISPVNCLMPQIVDNIAFIDELPQTNVTGGVNLLASTTTPDGNINVTDGNGTVSLPTSRSVSGTTEWKSFYLPGLVGNVSIVSSGPISVGYVGFNGAIGTASYFSGFDTVPVVDFTISGEGCLGSTITITNAFDTYQWYQNDVAVSGATSREYTPTAIGEVYVEVSSGGCSFDSNTIAMFYCEPEIVLNKTVDQENVDVGDVATFTITVQSLGIGEVTNLNIEDTLPEGLTLIDATPTKGTWASPNWSVDTLTPGELQSIVITATVDNVPANSSSNILVNTAFNTQDQTDNNIEKDDPTAIVIVGNDSDNDGIDNDIDLDDDNDGILDIDETNVDTDGDGIINSIDLDSDNDGISDLIEAGGADTDGDGRVDNFIDANNDGFSDSIAANPLEDPNTDGDAVVDRLDIDSDNDGIPDNVEAQTTDGYIPPSGNDSDNDGIDDAYDFGSGTPITPEDTDNDTIPDYLDEDSDGDSVMDNNEGNDFDFNGVPDQTFTGTDTDGDGLDDGYEGADVNDGFDVNDEIDSPATDLPNTDGTEDVNYRDLDDDGDGINTIDEDIDGDNDHTNDDTDSDGIPDYLDPTDDRIDTDGDGVPDETDLDDDNDGILDTDEDPNVDGDNNPLTDAQDSDNDGFPDTIDIDSDNDGIPDNVEAQTTDGYILPSGNDSDNDGIDDAYDFGSGTGITPEDTDNDTIPDYLDEDSDGDSVSDNNEGNDFDFNGVPDQTFTGTDTDGDGLDDGYEGDDVNDGFDVNDEIDSPAADLPNTDGTEDANYRDLDDDGDGISTLDEDSDGDDDSTNDDTDGDGTPNYLDPTDDRIDTDGDGVPDETDLDDDNDGILDTDEDPNVDGDNDSLTDPQDSDNDGLPDAIDIDSDNDGIPDNVEAQTTDGYIPPSGNDSDGDGLDDVYEGTGNEGIFPVDTDNDLNPDYMDTDADDDGINDVDEADQGTATGTDADNDGLDDGFEGTNINDGFDVNDEIADPATDLPDVQNPGGDVDFRDDQLPNIELEFECDPQTGLDTDGNPCVYIDNQSVGPQIDEGFFRINNIDFFQDNTLKIFNRWGVLVYETNSYDSSNNNFRGISTARATINAEEELPSGTYYYILDYTVNGQTNILSGYLYLVR